MSDDIFYPPINQQQIALISRLYEAHPNYFDRPECPYSKEVKEAFKKTGMVHDFDTHNISELPNSDNMLEQINQLMYELKNYGQSINSEETTSASDRNTYFRLSVTLLEKLVDIKEKIGKIKDYEVFTTAVLDVMDRILTPDQRTEVMEKLERLVEPSDGIGGEPKDDKMGALNATKDETTE